MRRLECKHDGRVSALTPRQIEILKLVTLPNRQAALKLHIVEQRVKNTWTEIYRRLGIDGDNCTKRIRATTKALRLGIVDLADFVFDFHCGDV